MKLNLFIKSMVIGVVTLFLVACSANNKSSTADKGSERLKIVTTFYPLYDFTKNVVGDKADVDLLIKGNAEVHSFEPSAKQIKALQEADVIVYQSAEMEPWITSALEAISTDGITIIEAGKDVTLIEPKVSSIIADAATDEHKGHDHETEEEHDHDHDHEGEEPGHSHDQDPHIWLNPKNAITEVETIRDALISLDEMNKETYNENAEAYIGQLNALDTEMAAGLENKKHHVFVTQHAAFSYLADRYGLEQLAMSGVLDNQEPDPKTVSQIVDYVNENKIGTIYYQQNTSSKVSEMVSNETKTQIGHLHSLETISEEDFAKGVSYIDLMKENLTQLARTIKD